MRKFFVFLLIGTYIVAFGVNLLPAIKHPDMNATLANLAVSVLFVMALFLVVRGRKSNLLKFFLIGGTVSGIIVFTIKSLESSMLGNGILDLIVSLQYPFYLLFTAPLFGANIMFNLNYAVFSLATSLLYFLVLIFFIKNNNAAVAG